MEASTSRSSAPQRPGPLKAVAWLDLSERKEKGEKIDSRAIKKHKNDIMRLSQVIDPENVSAVPERIKSDLSKFIEAVEEGSFDLKSLGVRGQSKEQVFSYLRNVYEIN